MEIEAEFGASQPIRWLTEDNVTFYGEDGEPINQVECTSCKKSLAGASCIGIIGSNCMGYMCKECAFNDSE